VKLTPAERRVRELERKGRVDPASPAGAVLFAGTERRGSEAGRDGALTISLVAKEVGIEIRADALLDVVRVQLLQKFRIDITEGRRPDTGAPQKPLPEAKAEAKGRRSPHRGYATGVFADGLRSPKMTGTTANARSRILPPTTRNVYVATEAKRGVFFLLLGPSHERLMQDATDTFIDKAIADAAGVRGVVMVPKVSREAGDG
jgi:hypothetical protein